MLNELLHFLNVVICYYGVSYIKTEFIKMHTSYLMRNAFLILKTSKSNLILTSTLLNVPSPNIQECS